MAEAAGVAGVAEAAGVAGVAGVAEVAGAETAQVAVGAEVAEAAEVGPVAVGGDDDDEEEWGGGRLRTAVSEPSYGQLRRVREQLQRPARTWSLELGGSVLLRRTGDLLEAVRAPGGGGAGSGTCGGSGGDGAAAEALRWFDAYDAQGNVDVRVAHPAHCRLRVARLTEGSAAAAGAAAGAAGCEGMVLHNVPAGSRLLVRAWRDGDVHQPHAKPKPLKITALAARGHAPIHHAPCSAAAGRPRLLGIHTTSG